MNARRWLDMKAPLERFLGNISGATAMEYGLIVALIAAVLVHAVTLDGRHLRTTFRTVAAKVL